VAWEVIPTPRVEKSPASRQPPQTPVLQKPRPSTPPQTVLTKSDLLFIKDLNPAEKSKIALMIQQIVKLEQTCAELRDGLENMTTKFEKKSVLCSEVEVCMEGLASENEKLKAENRSKAEILQDYSNKLEETSKLLRVSSSTNKKLQKKLNVKHHCKQVQTEGTEQHDQDTQTDSPDSSASKPDVVEDSMALFLNKLDSLCDKLSTVEREPVKSSEPVIVHNHKTEGQLVNPSLDPNLTFEADENHPIEPGRIKDSVILVREQVDKRSRSGVKRYGDRLISLIDEMEQSAQEEDTLLDDLFFKVK